MTQQTLSPAPTQIGIASPALGPWFSSTSITLPAPAGASLALSLSLASCDWLPPTSGTLSFHVNTATRPLAIASLREPGGASPFAANAIVVLFRILAEAEERLHSLMRYVPLPTASPLSSSIDFATLTPQSEPTRARVRALALEIAPGTSGSATLTTLFGLLSPSGPSDVSDNAKATYLGLRLDGTTLENGSYDVADLKRAGQFTLGGGTPRGDVLLRFPAGSPTVKLHAFDAAGRALDPGAVACWWRFLTSVFSNLWAEGITASNDQRIVSVASGDHLLAQLVNAHEGPPSGALFTSRLNVTNGTGTGALRKRGTSGALTFAFTAAPAGTTPDNAPIPRVALLPRGTYGSSVALWPGGALHTTLTRDHVRVAIVDVEQHVIGVPRVFTGTAATPMSAEQRRAKFQAQESTRIRVEKLHTVTSGEIGPLTTIERANRAILDVFGGTGPTTLITSVAERDFGVFEVTPAMSGTPIDALPVMTVPAGMSPVTHHERVVGIVSAVTGAGQTSGSTVSRQSVAIDLNLGASAAGALVRAWSYGLNHQTGIHFRLNGATARVRAGGALTILLPLPDGSASPPAQMNVDLAIVTPSGTRFFYDLRFVRPAAIAGTALAITAATGQILICETGEILAPSALTGRVPPGANLLAINGTSYALIDRATLPATAFVPATLIRTLASGDTVRLTQPAFATEPQGDTAATLGTSGATVTRSGRTDVVPGTPLATMERLEVIAARVTSSEARAAVGAARTLGRSHELLPHATGHPGAPATAETHATGVTLTGGAAVAVAEIARDRAKWFLPDLFIDAMTPMRAPSGTASTLWAAPLRTVASGVDEPITADALVNMPTLFPAGEIPTRVQDWIRNRRINPPAGAPEAVVNVINQINTALSTATIPTSIAEPAASVARAMDRRIIASAYGMKETAVAVKAAFERAEDLIYIESPAIDLQPAVEKDSSDATLETLEVVRAAITRLGSRPALRVLLCVPVRHMTEAALIASARDHLMRDALETLRNTSNGALRVAFFSPAAGPGRTLRMSSTTVIVDDAFLVTGATHLSRRGLTFDSSLAISLFDEDVTGGRPRAIRTFRRQLIANRLGTDESLVPDEPAELLDAVRLFVERGGGTKLALESIERPQTAPSATDLDARNPDGSRNPTFRVDAWLNSLAALATSATEVVAP